MLEIFRMMEEERYRELITKGSMLLGHLRVSILTVGSEVMSVMERAERLRVARRI